LAILNFDARNVAPDTGDIAPVPAGYYNIMMTESEMKPVKDKEETSAYLATTYTILDGEFKGHKLFDRFNLKNENPVAREIGYKKLSAVSHAVGVLMVQDSAQLHNIPLKVKVKLTPAVTEKDAAGTVFERYAAKNEITTYKNINEAIVGAVAAPAAAAVVVPPAAVASPVAVAPAQATPAWAGATAQPWAAAAQTAPVEVPVAPVAAVPTAATAGAPPPWAVK
jgi:hypothetical protein